MCHLQVRLSLCIYLLFLRNFYVVNHLNNTKLQQMLPTFSSYIQTDIYYLYSFIKILTRFQCFLRRSMNSKYAGINSNYYIYQAFAYITILNLR
jgi:hypothetical protein